MYPSRGNNAYGRQQQQQQSYSGQSAFGQNLGRDGVPSHMSMTSGHSAILGGRPTPAGAQYGGQYSSVYGSMTGSALQAPATNAKGSGPSALEGRSGYGSAMQESPKFASGDYSKYGQKGEHTFTDKLSDYPSGDWRQYVERPGAYSSRDLQNEIAFGHQQHQADVNDRLDAAAALRQELLQAQALQSASIEGSSRQADYLAARAAAVRQTGQEILPYGRGLDTDPNTLSMISGLPHRGSLAQSVLGAAPRRNVDDLRYSANPGYGVNLPPGRDYASGKGLHGTPVDPGYTVLARTGYGRPDGHKDERRDEERRRELLSEREKDRECEREQERERERERVRERRRERERILERREKERDRVLKRVSEIKRERTPPRISRERGGSSSTKAERSLRRESPRGEASHRRLSPVKEKQREYICKVYSSSLVDIERDYLAVDKRYPRLFTSPECAKVIVNWSKGNFKIPFNVPVSFEHDFVQDETETRSKTTPVTSVVDKTVKSEHGSIRWNAKIILMSGLSRNALEELSSEREYGDRIPHFCNMLRFACLKNGNSFVAIGGMWETIDGNDPSVDKSILIQTAIRHAKALTGLDLKNCRHWNPFLEIHYDRTGKDGTFSHKEITVLYVPDLSDCLPSVDAWKDQWLAHKKAIAERERLLALEREMSREKKEGVKDKEPATTKDPKKASKLKEKAKSKAKETRKEAVQSDAVIEKNNGVEAIGEGNNAGNENQVEVPDVQKTGTGKKKIIRKVLKKKVLAEKDKAGNTAKQNDVLAPTKTEASGKEEESSHTPAVKAFTRKKVTKKVPVAKAVKNEEITQSEVITVKNEDVSEDKLKKANPSSASGKTTVKKKIIKRVAKKNVSKDANSKDKVAEEAGTTIGEQSVTSGNQESELKLESKESGSMTKASTVASEPKKDENESKNVKEGKKGKVDSGSSSKMKIDGQSENNEKSKDGEKPKEGKVKKIKAEPKGKEVKDKKKIEEPPRHPGLFLQTKGSRDSVLRSLSLSLDSLLGYDDNDVEESTFELSLFAETFYEMLQYQMGSRLLTFLQKLRIKFVAKRNQKKRQREEVSDKEKEKVKKTSSAKRVKIDDSTVEIKIKSIENENMEETHQEDEKAIAKVENTLTDNVENTNDDQDENLEDPEDLEEDSEEDPQEDEDMADASPKNVTANEKFVAEKVGVDVKPTNVRSEQEKSVEDSKKQEKEKAKAKADIKKNETTVSIDKELLQAFRFFDRNRVGHIRVEDMRLIIHNLGHFLSHRDVKELVQSALLESNTGRDDHILYNKLVRITDI